MSTERISRRAFVKTSAASAVAVGLPAIVPAHVLGKTAPANTLRMGCIGTGRMGHGDMQECLSQGLQPTINARVVAVCDLDRRRAEHARQTAARLYAQSLPEPGRPAIEVFDDYRELLARPDIDGVTISTPDHWHALIAIAAAEAGKDVYLQKPLTYSIVEGQKLVAAVRKNQVVLQIGSQQRSDRSFRKACELVRNGRVGKLHTIQVLLPTDSGNGDATAMPVPADLNYDMWLGPAAERLHGGPRPSPDRLRPARLAADRVLLPRHDHRLGVAHVRHCPMGPWHGRTGPIEIEATAEFPDRGLFNVHTNFRAEGRYADGVQLLAQTGTPAGVKFTGDLAGST